jgi:protein-S-isoprenylcysteine O-methyltransferase Ste14
MKAFLRFVWFPALVLSVVFFWLRLDRRMGWHGPQAPLAGFFLVAAGCLLASWCNLLFLDIGKGTAHPFTAKTKHLVIAGPYRYVRNPMMWGVGALLAGTALWIGSLGLWFGVAMLVLFLSFFVPYYEEPDMERRFGEEYRDYCRRVPRWIPRFRSKP